MSKQLTTQKIHWLCKLGFHKHVVKDLACVFEYYRCLRNCGHIYKKFKHIPEVQRVDLTLKQQQEEQP